MAEKMQLNEPENKKLSEGKEHITPATSQSEQLSLNNLNAAIRTEQPVQIDPALTKGNKAKKGRPAKDKTAPAKGKTVRDKLSQSKAGKTAPEQPAAKEGPAAPAKAEPAAPVVDEPTEPAPLPGLWRNRRSSI